MYDPEWMCGLHTQLPISCPLQKQKFNAKAAETKTLIENDLGSKAWQNTTEILHSKETKAHIVILGC